MKLSLVGVGDAGTRIVDRLLEAEASTARDFTNGNVLAFNTTATAFERATAIPEDRRVLIGDTHPDVNQITEGSSTPETGGDTAEAETVSSDDTVGAETVSSDDQTPQRSAAIDRSGVGGDPDAGVAVARDELPEIRRTLDLVDETDVDATMLVVGFGGGTGCGVGSVLLEELQSVYEHPVYVLGALPATTEPDRRALTAARAVRTVVPMADAVIPIDNEAWRNGADRIASRYDEINDAIATRVLSLFAVGEAASIADSEMRIDPADVRRTLAVGGLASIGYATFELDAGSGGLLARLRQAFGLASEAETDATTDAATIKQLIRRTLESKLTLPCDVSTSDRVLLILSGPPGDISRKGFETGRYLLEQETDTVEVLAGDEPLSDADTITATVLLSNVTGVPPIEALQQRAVAYQTGSDAQTDDEHEAGDEHDVGDEHEFEFHGDTSAQG